MTWRKQKDPVYSDNYFMYEKFTLSKNKENLKSGYLPSEYCTSEIYTCRFCIRKRMLSEISGKTKDEKLTSTENSIKWNNNFFLVVICVNFS